MIAPEWVAVSGFGRRRSLSALAVWGFPEFSRKIFPLKPCSTLFHLFSSSHPFPPIPLPPQNPLSTSLDQVNSPFLPFQPHFFSSEPFLLPLSLFIGPYRTLSETLRNPSLGPPKGPYRPKKTLFRPF